MPAPLAKGIIIAASIVVAAGIAIYESPQVRAWVDQSRRKIAIALHNLGDDIQPRRASESSDDFDARKRRRDELIRHNRNELIRRAREDGVAVDLDELARIGDEEYELAERRSRADRSKSFDTLVGTDGMLKNDTTATGTDASHSGLRKRGAAGFAAGSATMSDPFADETVLFDVGDDDDAPSPREFTYTEPSTRASTATLDAQSPPLIDLTSDLPAGPATATPDDAEPAAQSFYSVTSQAAPPLAPFFDDEAASHVSTGTLTPRSERSHSVVADDVDVFSMQNDADHDARSESDFTEGGFSEFGNDGVMTPNSWTDVGSDDGSEWGGAMGNGHVSQVQQ